MREEEILMNPNPLVAYLKKPASEFTRHDLVQFAEENGIEMVNFRYVAEDGKLKTLNFIINSRAYLDTILAAGERVDGSSLFSFIEPGASDLYVVPRYRTAFVNPFSDIPSLEIMASFYTREGTPLASSPDNVLRKAARHFTEKTGYRFKALGELEYYVNSQHDPRYPLIDQKGYHQSKPFAKFEDLRLEALRLTAMAGGRIKYGHSEVGSFSTETEDFEQHEIEFLPVDVEDAADQMHIARWILRMLSYRHGVEVSFAPKITVGKAGSGMHIHMLLEKNGKNVMTDGVRLSDTARKMIAGILDLAGALTAFGNTIPTSYLRLVPHQEAPTSICWGDRNRSVLVRVPLGWTGTANMVEDANPGMKNDKFLTEDKQTIEFRAPDGSADIYSLLAGLVVAARHGLEMDHALELARRLYVDVNIFDEKHKSKAEKLEHLPASCWESAMNLEKKRAVFEKDGVFPASLIDHVIKKLRSYQDENLSERLCGKEEEIHRLVLKYIHYH
ncbi:MAG TPA: glutamine synthetase [Bacteroidetes bacterium]|nr:glutamine synthetase [Bacteroidota bacterium]